MRSTRRYEVDTCTDDPEVLRKRLQDVADEGGRVISVAWQSRRHASLSDPTSYAAKSEYTIVSEHEAGLSTRVAPERANRWKVGVSAIGAAA
jgi:hypothetical protein